MSYDDWVYIGKESYDSRQVTRYSLKPGTNKFFDALGRIYSKFNLDLLTNLAIRIAIIIIFLSYYNVFSSDDIPCNDTAALNKIIAESKPEMVSYINLYCFKKAIEIRCHIPSFYVDLNHEYDILEEYREYEKRGLVINCDDTLNFNEREINPSFFSFRRGFDDECYYFGTFRYLSYELAHKIEETHIRKRYNGAKTITKITSCKDVYERFRTEYDSSGNLKVSDREITQFRELLSSRVEIWDKGKLVRMKYNNVNRSIVQGKTPCYLKILEQNETVIIQLDPEKEPLPLIQKDVIDSAEVYDVIKYHWYPHCKKYHETEKAAEINLSLENEPGVPVKNDDNSSSYLLPYKYYFIILVCIVIAGVVVVYRKRKRGRK